MYSSVEANAKKLPELQTKLRLAFKQDRTFSNAQTVLITWKADYGEDLYAYTILAKWQLLFD